MTEMMGEPVLGPCALALCQYFGTMEKNGTAAGLFSVDAMVCKPAGETHGGEKGQNTAL